MKIAVFSDATSHHNRQKTGTGFLAYDVTYEHAPILLFQKSQPIPFCPYGPAENRAATIATSFVADKIAFGGLHADSVTLFTDCEQVFYLFKNNRIPELSFEVSRLGCPFYIEVIPRKLNRRADHLAHLAVNSKATFVPIPPDRTAQLIEEYPFLNQLNA